MLPVMMFAYAYGFGPGILCGVAYGILQMFQDPYIVGWVQAALDYILPFGLLALVALFRKWDSPLNFSVGVIVAGVVRVICHVLSGVVYFADYAPEGMDPLVYSLGYNLTSVGVDALICAVIGFIPPVRRFARQPRRARQGLTPISKAAASLQRKAQGGRFCAEGRGFLRAFPVVRRAEICYNKMLIYAHKAQRTRREGAEEDSGGNKGARAQRCAARLCGRYDL